MKHEREIAPLDVDLLAVDPGGVAGAYALFPAGSTQPSAVGICKKKVICATAIFNKIPYPKSEMLLLIEDQRLVHGRGTGRSPQQLIDCARAAGFVAGLFADWIRLEVVSLLSPLNPATWKGQLDKHVSQGRAYRDLGWQWERRSDYAVPKLPESIDSYNADSDRPLLPGDWKDVGDAVGIGVWALRNPKKLKGMLP